MRRAIAASVGLLLCAVGAKCKKAPEGPMAVCSSEVEGSEAAETASGDVPAEVWFALLLKKYNPKTGEIQRPVSDCTGKPAEVQDEAVVQCITPENPPAVLPSHPLDGEKDLEIVGIDDGKALVWVRTDYFDNGDALGPLALAEYRRNGVAVRAIGGLRANPNRIKLRLEKMADSTVVVAESMVCDPKDPKKCNRVMRLVPQDGMRFVERPLVDAESGECLGPATFPLDLSQEITREDGRVRRFELARIFKFEEGAVTVSEQVTIKDLDPKEPDAPPTVFRKAQVERPLTLGEGGLRTTGPLWESMLAEHGSVELKPEEKEGTEAAAEAEAG